MSIFGVSDPDPVRNVRSATEALIDCCSKVHAPNTKRGNKTFNVFY
jgi:hypothetical protein